MDGLKIGFAVFSSCKVCNSAMSTSKVEFRLIFFVFVMAKAGTGIPSNVILIGTVIASSAAFFNPSTAAASSLADGVSSLGLVASAAVFAAARSSVNFESGATAVIASSVVFIFASN